METCDTKLFITIGYQIKKKQLHEFRTTIFR